LADQLTLRLQGGSFNTFRTFLAYSPQLRRADAFLAYEGSRSDGPFENPLRYKRDNFTANYTRHLDEHEAVGVKLNAGRNDFFSSGQLPLDEVAAGRLDRFGFIDPYDGGRVRNATLGTYYRREGAAGDILRLDGFVARSLFDLFSNFTFFLSDPVNGDAIQQHDSRLQEGVNAQYLRPFVLFGQHMLFTSGSNLHDNQIDVALFPRVRRQAIGTTTSAHAHVTNTAGYFQQGADFWAGRLHADAGLRFDYFRFDVTDRLQPAFSGTQSASRFQPKANVSFTPSQRFPLTFYFNYGRGIASEDARGVVQRPSGPKISTTDFYQAGTSHRLKRVSLSTDVFFIDRSNEQVYIPDDGSFEFKGPSRAYGFEVKTSAQLTSHLTVNGGLTRVSNAFYRGTSPRVYVDSGPHGVANAALTLSGWRGFNGSLRYRHISSYRLDGVNASIRAAGLDVVDLSLCRPIRRGVEFNLAIDNLTNKRFYETQNYFTSRLRPGDPAVSRIHGSPGYPIGVTVGLTFRLFAKAL
jgi:TonB dependent receptor